MLIAGNLRRLDIVVFNAVVVQPVERFCGRSLVEAVKHIHDFGGTKAYHVHNVVSELLAIGFGYDTVSHRVIDDRVKNLVGAGHFLDFVLVHFVLDVIVESEFVQKTVAYVNYVEVVQKQVRLRVHEQLLDLRINNHFRFSPFTV